MNETATVAGSGYEVAGDLTLHGVTRPVALTMAAPGDDQASTDATSMRREFAATTRLDRQ